MKKEGKECSCRHLQDDDVIRSGLKFKSPAPSLRRYGPWANGDVVGSLFHLGRGPSLTNGCGRDGLGRPDKKDRFKGS